MGSSTSKYNSCGGIILQLEVYSGFAGEVLSGVVHMKVSSPISPSTLYIFFKGKEVINFLTFKISNGYSPNYRKNSIIKFIYRICEYPETLMPGGYSIPFTLRLPKNLPGTFRYPFRNRSSKSAFIAYKFHAKLLNAVPKQELKGKADFTIKNNTKRYKTDLEGKIEARLSRCCFNNGICQASFVQTKSFFNSTEVASILLKIDNSQSNLGVKAIKYKLFNNLRMTSTHRTKFKKRNLIQSVIKIRILPRSSSLIENQVEILLDLPSVTKKIGNTYSTNGKLIGCAYILNVKVVMDTCCFCCVKSPSLKTPLNIVSYTDEPSRSIEIPSDWRPLVAERVIAEENPSQILNSLVSRI